MLLLQKLGFYRLDYPNVAMSLRHLARDVEGCLVAMGLIQPNSLLLCQSLLLQPLRFSDKCALGCSCYFSLRFYHIFKPPFMLLTLNTMPLNKKLLVPKIQNTIIYINLKLNKSRLLRAWLLSPAREHR
jgi:hypothetical protein